MPLRLARHGAWEPLPSPPADAGSLHQLTLATNHQSDKWPTGSRGRNLPAAALWGSAGSLTWWHGLNSISWRPSSLGCKSQAVGIQNAAFLHPGSTAPSLLPPHGSGRPRYLLLCACQGATGKKKTHFLEVLSQTQWKRLWFGGISAGQYIEPGNGRDHSLLGGWRRQREEDK